MQHIKLILLLGFALVVHIQHGLYTLRSVYHASYWGQFTMCSVWREILTGGMNATLDRGNRFKDTGHSSSHGNALLVRKVTQGHLKDWL